MKLKRGDIILFAVILIAVLAFIVPKFIGDKGNPSASDKLYAKLTVDGQLIKTVELTEEEQLVPIDSKFGHNVLKIHNRGIEMHEANCPDDVCFTFGFVTKPRGTIVCLPNRLLVEIVGGSNQGDELDASTS
ncbi:NusG domain II-containing protein [Paenibacillus albiflavus]|uniref:NusG domain II-containing protein n=1 Tax=Paenibacillus albiflavus TaxID=2545760 RepID=A0A4R4EBN9_9BACL|nr:NusG domain II-containing protein [Paenibacillus albiflavus]TCZ76360.1 NusG domain II-containing protein [Paenibacillus albiflavus]